MNSISRIGEAPPALAIPDRSAKAPNAAFARSQSMKQITFAQRLAVTAFACALAFAQPVAAEAPAQGGAAEFQPGHVHPAISAALGGIRQFGAHSSWWSDGRLGLIYPYVWGSDGEPDHLYYCQHPEGYYPAVTQCSSWQPISAN
jgi:hypothetical protein